MRVRFTASGGSVPSGGSGLVLLSGRFRSMHEQKQRQLLDLLLFVEQNVVRAEV